MDHQIGHIALSSNVWQCRLDEYETFWLPGQSSFEAGEISFHECPADWNNGQNSSGVFVLLRLESNTTSRQGASPSTGPKYLAKYASYASYAGFEEFSIFTRCLFQTCKNRVGLNGAAWGPFPQWSRASFEMGNWRWRLARADPTNGCEHVLTLTVSASYFGGGSHETSATRSTYSRIILVPPHGWILNQNDA